MAKDKYLDLGSGYKKRPSTPTEEWLGIDIRKFPNTDYVLDLGKDKLPFEDNSISGIQAIHLFEHFYPEQLFHCIEECFRVLKGTGKLHIEVPKAMTPAYFIHPDHKLPFLEDTFGFFQVPGDKEHNDPHGYLKGFWHVCIIEQPFNQHIHVDMYPNKPNGRFNYVEVKQL